ncbi:Aste57867_11259 [Aphanomyces stellatus]|uniref:Aste57867_11259 protein n=1 Tax=Aphanomyces stellatus TaxID=120398 RepID=A0A485KUC2_9STRA|nr:hypothetical protein As57867_011217 [Aphanomyces stellatus]VFT88123.1 Aste57867_11259 [Aphanomyces stellatus]
MVYIQLGSIQQCHRQCHLGHASGCQVVELHAGPATRPEIGPRRSGALALANEITHFQPRWSNLRTIGIEETIDVTNALGLTSTIRIKHDFATIARATCTAQVLVCPFGSSIYAINNHGATKASPNAIQNYWVGSHLAPLLQVLHNQLGALGNVLCNFIAPPAAVVSLVEAFQAGDWRASQGQPYAATVAGTGRCLYGGSPLCPYHSSKPYLLASFGADDTCMTYAKYGVTWTPAGALFAWLMSDPSQVPLIASICTAQAAATQAALARFDASSLSTTAAATALAHVPLEMMQFISRNNNASNVAIETQPLLAGPWAAFGYMSVYDWVHGTREVVAFDGDVQVLTLVLYSTFTNHYSSTPAPTTSGLRLALPCTGSRWRRQSSQLPSRRAPPIASSRPLRHDAAQLACLQSRRRLCVGRSLHPLCPWPRCGHRHVDCQRGLQPSDGLTGLTRHPRNVFDSMALAGETLWLLYIANDVLHSVTDAFTSSYAPIGAILAWLTISILDIAQPPTFSLFRNGRPAVRVHNHGNPNFVHKWVDSDWSSRAFDCYLWHPRRLVDTALKHLLPPLATPSSHEASCGRHRVPFASHRPWSERTFNEPSRFVRLVWRS